MINTPIIPNDIVVHLGKPSDNARNITIPFPEYIKNVASSEIYPTWPESAIRANILAQISFALNRVYNEWYRSQGYNFDITNSPIYDQAFVEDRQFFDVISRIVDEIFNNYVVREGQVQPLFARYCDGVKTKCEGLSQWGSVTLARQGFSPLEILRYYYGNDIDIVYDVEVADNIESFPGFNLKIGDAGNFIRTLKVELNRISKNYPSIPTIIDDSVFFTSDLEEAVKKFQEIFNLDVTGIVDKATWYKIKYLYNAVKKITDIYSEGISSEEAELILPEVIQEGDTGYLVGALNYYLNIISFFDNNIPFLNLQTEEYTSDTKEVVEAFQRLYNIEVTGKVDVNTWIALREAYLQTLDTIPTEYLEYIDEFYPGYFLVSGMVGDDVLRLQKFLYKICEATHEIPGVRVSGIYDDLTKKSVTYIQQKYNLNVTGVVDPVTWYRIVEWSKEIML